MALMEMACLKGEKRKGTLVEMAKSEGNSLAGPHPPSRLGRIGLQPSLTLPFREGLARPTSSPCCRAHRPISRPG